MSSRSSRSQAIHQPASARLSPADQWSSVSAVLEASVAGAEEAHKLQTAATQLLDLAQYGISTLVDELSAVMTIPGRRDRQVAMLVLDGAAVAEANADWAFQQQHRRARAA
jgi:predicted amidohydrolase